MQKLIAFFSGRKTYIAALALLLHAILEKDTGQILEAVSILFLRAGVTKSGPPTSQDTASNTSTPGNAPTHIVLVFLSLLSLSWLLVGCSLVTVHNVRPDGTKTIARLMVPAYPWQDSAKSLERLTVSSRTNYFQTSLRGYDEAESTSSNSAHLVESLGAAMMRGAVQVLKPAP
jgi:hypothetical protein